MAEFIFKDIVARNGREKDFFVSSHATSYEEEGNPVYPPARRVLAAHGVPCSGKFAQRLEKSDYEEFDLFVCMEERNAQNALRIFGADPDKKLCKLLDFTDQKGNIADPYYTGDFELTYRQIYAGCQALFSCLVKK